ncbi:uncharacterized protein BYT42DRAFT_25674 [Radiomyces spectabilis]|uniref:uncharacterized protein n=1 Tax=Radiomyces spectabilis TaxID=64574 RepID=UPI00221F5197|nr:uncharacterized protein BYT42DRAFT_25674 [Radiomyces spectabilis]KAI8393956.1 hypothetical protein BYT42DRAFT_25674 [Radiomyces spectabilis]
MCLCVIYFSLIPRMCASVCVCVCACAFPFLLFFRQFLYSMLRDPLVFLCIYFLDDFLIYAILCSLFIYFLFHPIFRKTVHCYDITFFSSLFLLIGCSDSS